MSPRPRVRGRMIPAFVGCFYAGIVTGWLLHRAFTPAGSAAAEAVAADVPKAAATSGDTASRGLDERVARGLDETLARENVARGLHEGVARGLQSPRQATDRGTLANPIAELRSRQLRLPIDDAGVEALAGDFSEKRDAGGRTHEAVDILAPRNTPIHAVENGVVAKLFFSKAGGITIYQFDPSERFCYYYAHLERYAANLAEGQHVSKGQVIGYVGTSGNAPANTPHLHFAIFELNADRRWWQGTPLDPYLVFRR
jgi:peptidoglycan LD-endopeptidase LytH